MKIQLDYDKKEIAIEDNANLGKLFSRIKEILPDWDDWELKTKTKITYEPFPYVVREHRPIYRKFDRPWDDSVTFDTVTKDITGMNFPSRELGGTVTFEL